MKDTTCVTPWSSHCSSLVVVATQTASPTKATPQVASGGHTSTSQQHQEHHHTSQPPWTSPRQGRQRHKRSPPNGSTPELHHNLCLPQPTNPCRSPCNGSRAAQGPEPSAMHAPGSPAGRPTPAAATSEALQPTQAPEHHARAQRHQPRTRRSAAAAGPTRPCQAHRAAQIGPSTAASTPGRSLSEHHQAAHCSARPQHATAGRQSLPER
jgi:hypothetical protein